MQKVWAEEERRKEVVYFVLNQVKTCIPWRDLGKDSGSHMTVDAMTPPDT